MYSTKIEVGADTSGIREATRDCRELNREMRGIGDVGEDLNLDEAGIDARELVQELRQGVRELRDLSGEAKRGGFFSDALKKATALSGKLREDFSAYRDLIDDATSALSRLQREKRKILNQAPGSAAENERRMLRMEEIDFETKRITKERAELQKRSGEVDNLEYGAERAAPPGQMGSLIGLGKKALGAYGVVFGAMSLLNMAKEAKDVAVAYEKGQAGFAMRSGSMIDFDVTRANRLAGPMETLAVADTINRASGIAGDKNTELTDAIIKFSKTSALESSRVAGLIGQNIGPLGTDAEGVRSIKGMLEAFSAVGEKYGIGGRLGEMLEMNSRVIAQASESLGGRELTGGELDKLLSFQTQLWAQPGQIGKGSSGAAIMGAAHSAITGGGRNPAEQMMLWRTLGGGKMSVGGLESFERTLEAGLTKDTINKVYAQIKSTYGAGADGDLSDIGRRAFRSFLRGGDPNMTWGQTDVLRNILSSKGKVTESDMAEMRAAGRGIQDTKLEAWKETMGGGFEIAEAQIQANQVYLGGPAAELALGKAKTTAGLGKAMGIALSGDVSSYDEFGHETWGKYEMEPRPSSQRTVTVKLIMDEDIKKHFKLEAVPESGK